MSINFEAEHSKSIWELRDDGGGVQRVAKVVHGHNSVSYRLVVTTANIPAPDPDNAGIRIEWDLYTFSSCDGVKQGWKDDAWVTKSLGTSPDKLPGSSVWCEICVICELVILIPGLVSLARGLSSSNGSWRGSPVSPVFLLSLAHTGDTSDIWWPLSWSRILRESYNDASYSSEYKCFKRLRRKSLWRSSS